MRRRELAIRWTLRESSEPPVAGPAYSATPIRGPQDLIRYLAPWAAEPQEVAVVVLLDSRMRILGYREVGRGSSTSCPLDAKVVVQAALMGGACAAILGHNHPSGDVTPSFDDVHVTQQIKEAGEVVGIPVLDHIIVGLNGEGDVVHCSLKEIGKL